jgi:4-hydroxythreonine-4-phosphate dehydrogenase
MYHDQGQIALKLKGFERSVTLGGGIPVPIGTCAHGTAFDIVGKGIASETSLKNAMNIIIKMAGDENEKI